VNSSGRDVEIASGEGLDLHIVGGFLGSGKTTAIVGAAKYLMSQGKRVGVVTNDQGKYLVDTAFFQAAAVPAVEVTGGCFCCNYEDLEDQLARLRASVTPDVIFAESVGSCADIVATVVKPLLELRVNDEHVDTTFSVFADARLLRRRLLDQPMPFSDEVVYLFDKQIEEAAVLIINKRDLLSAADAAEVRALAETRFPDKWVRLQNSLNPQEVEAWALALEAGGHATAYATPATSLDIDYARYGAGEARLAWLDEMLTFNVPSADGRAVVIRFMDTLITRLRREEVAVGHLKFLVSGGQESAKVSFPTLIAEDWEQEVPVLSGSEIQVLVNARAEIPAARLRDLVADAAETTTTEAGATYEASHISSFHPAFPKPTHRIG
jgi:Ni2+-binding GTPase involved in maturation of urease and hydrogenase